MPEEGMEWLERDDVLSFEEIERISALFVQRFGVEGIRLTGGEPTVRAGIVTRRLLDLPPYVLAPLGHPLARGPVALADVAAHPLVLLDRPVAEPYVTALFRDLGLAPRIAARANTTEMVRSLVGAGAGLAVLNMRPRTDRSYAGDGLTALPLNDEVAPITLLVGRAEGRPKRAVAVMQDLLLGWASGPRARDLIVARNS